MQKPKTQKTPLVTNIIATLLTSLVLSILTIPLTLGTAYLAGLLPEYHKCTIVFALVWTFALCCKVALEQTRKG